MATSLRQLAWNFLFLAFRPQSVANVGVNAAQVLAVPEPGRRLGVEFFQERLSLGTNFLGLLDAALVQEELAQGQAPIKGVLLMRGTPSESRPPVSPRHPATGGRRWPPRPSG